MAISNYYPTVTEDLRDPPRQIAAVVRNLVDGKSNNKGEFTLSAGTSTVVTDDRISAESVILEMALSAAAGAITGRYWTAVSDGTATFNHSAAVGTETFRYAVIG